MENPFKYGGVVRGPYFADRRSEIKELRREMVNLNHVFLVSPRRFGKTLNLSMLKYFYDCCPETRSASTSTRNAT